MKICKIRSDVDGYQWIIPKSESGLMSNYKLVTVFPDQQCLSRALIAGVVKAWSMAARLLAKRSAFV